MQPNAAEYTSDKTTLLITFKNWDVEVQRRIIVECGALDSERYLPQIKVHVERSGRRRC
jgi:hypothetical protein